MQNREIQQAFAVLSTPLICDACVRVGIEPRVAPAGIIPVIPDSRLSGRIAPVQHFGTTDILLEAIAAAGDSDVLVVDNHGRDDEACLGDLMALEARNCGLAGIAIWGRHRDSADLLRIRLPLFSYGTFPAKSQRSHPRPPDALERALFGAVQITNNDVLFADSDGVVFVVAASVADVLDAAAAIYRKEREMAEAMHAGKRIADLRAAASGRASG